MLNRRGDLCGEVDATGCVGSERRATREDVDGDERGCGCGCCCAVEFALLLSLLRSQVSERIDPFSIGLCIVWRGVCWNCFDLDSSHLLSHRE